MELHHLHPNRRILSGGKSEILALWRAKIRLFCNPLKAFVPTPNNPFQRTAATKGITHTTFREKSCATKPLVSLDSSCQGSAAAFGKPPCQRERCPHWIPLPTGRCSPLLDDPEPKGIPIPSGHLDVFSAGRSQIAYSQFPTMH